MTSLIESFTNEFALNMGKPQRIYSIDNHSASSSLVPCKMRQKLYYLQSNIHACGIKENDFMNVLKEGVEQMFARVDELESVMHKLDGQMAEVEVDDGINCGTNVMDDELKMIYQTVVYLIKGMEENMERLERIVQKCS
ncbi:hypothetical protein RclHR1_00380043 [Rhizophagus clarus]|nr:hypothetical protein RclHR1_00380043 [Rhizophagus clarus]